MALQYQVSVRVPILLFDATGAPKPGITEKDIRNGQAVLRKGSVGVPQTSRLTLSTQATGQNWFEVSAQDFPGLYELLLPASELNVLGMLVWSIQPAASAFRGQVGSDQVIAIDVGTSISDLKTSIDGLRTTMQGIVASLQGVPGAVWDVPRQDHVRRGSFGEAATLQFHAAVGHVKINNNILTIYGDNGGVLISFNLRDVAGQSTSSKIAERIPIREQ